MGGRGGSSSMGGNSNSAENDWKIGPGHSAMNGNSPETIDTIKSLKTGSVIDVHYNTSGLTYVTDTYKLLVKHTLSGDKKLWVNTTNNGYRGDFGTNKTAIQNGLIHTKVKIVEEG